MLVIEKESEAIGHVAAMINHRNGFLPHPRRQQSSQRKAADSVISYEIIPREIRGTHSDADEVSDVL